MLKSSTISNQSFLPHIVIVIARGEALRNFAHSGVLELFSQQARLTLLTGIDDETLIGPYRSYLDAIYPFDPTPENRLVDGFRYILHMAHMRWMWTEAFKYHWYIHTATKKRWTWSARNWIGKALALPVSNRRALEILTPVERWLSFRLRPSRYYDNLFTQLKPDLVFNTSHIHGYQADLPMRVAHHLGYKTAVFLFSWDNLTSRSRIFVPYNHYFSWNEAIKRKLLELYPEIRADQVTPTGTPQFDFHFKPEFILSREELCRRQGLDPSRPFILYTTGMDRDFGYEYRIVEGMTHFIRSLPAECRPQLLVRTYIKGTSPEMLALARPGDPDVVFPNVQWEGRWITPLYDDIYTYTSLLHHCALGINSASTVSLELMIHDKPIINLGFEPPASNLPAQAKFARHVGYDHYRPVAESGAVMLARSMEDLYAMTERGLAEPFADSATRRKFISSFFDDRLDGLSGQRIVESMIILSQS